MINQFSRIDGNAHTTKPDDKPNADEPAHWFADHFMLEGASLGVYAIAVYATLVHFARHVAKMVIRHALRSVPPRDRPTCRLWQILRPHCPPRP